VTTAWLVLGGLHHLNGAVAPSPDDAIALVSLTEPLHDSFPSNTIVLRWADLGKVDVRGVGTVDGAELFVDLLPGPALRELATDPLRPLVPLFYLAVEGTKVHVHSQIRFLPEDACFIRVTPEPIEVADVEDLTWLRQAVRLHAENALFLNNHQRYYRKCFPGKEMEYKYTLTPPVDIWTLNADMYRRLRRGELPGYLMEYRDEFQAWDYLNHLYQVTDPEPDRGYVSFIPTTDGKNLMKRKWFAADSFERREEHTYGLVPEHGFDAYLRDELRVSATKLPAFRRIRYDVNFESARTGHVYGIFFDHVSLLDATDVVLNQCELEYLRTRSAVEPDEAEVLVEIEEIAVWLEAFLAEHGLDNNRGYYSKMTFLLDSVKARPELAVELGA